MEPVAGIVFASMWLVYAGQVISVADRPLAERLGLQEDPDTVDQVYRRDTAGTAVWDVLTMWTLPAAGLLMILAHPWWPYLALVGGAVYVDTGGRQAIKLLGYRREGIRVGTPRAVSVALGAYAVFLVLGAAAIILALIAIDPL
jgi:hypothetical protein